MQFLQKLQFHHISASLEDFPMGHLLGDLSDHSCFPQWQIHMD